MKNSSQIINPNRTLDAYDAIAPVYAEYSANRQAYLDAIDALVIARLRPGMDLLDVGAGDGRRLSKIQSAIALNNITAIEPSKNMAEICAQKAGVTPYQVFAEDIDQLHVGPFDAVTALWNVFGHIPNSESRLKALRNIAAKLKRDGIFMLDVNNRHNALAYGTAKVMGRVIMDTLNFDERRGDASYDWKIGDQIFKGSGHLFTPGEIESLFKNAGLKIIERFSLNYATGALSTSPYRGQLFYMLGRV